ncbi:MAG: hypothetical protein ACREDH_15350 [Methylocella sp.]
MAQEYPPRRFFRNAPNLLLQRYFGARNVLSEVDFGVLTETQVEPIYEAWLKLSDDARKHMEQDFQDIDELATEGGSKAILDEARWHGEDLADQFASLTGFHEHAFWTILERPKYWQGALAFHHADAVPFSYWRKRKNVARKPARVDALSIRQLEQNLSNYFHRMQGRGENCKVDCYKRNDLDYYFAYPEDYAQASVEWVNKEFKRRPHHPAFEIIFVYSQNDGTLDIYLTGDRKPVPDLQAIFADTILKAELGPDEKDERVYDLNPVRSRQFQFVYGPESGITDVAVKKLRLTVYGKKGRILLEADPTNNRHAIFDLLDKVAKGIPLTQMAVTQVGIKVTFVHNPTSRKASTRSFDVNWPNSCSLKHDGRDLIIRKLLADSGIEPTKPAKDDSPAP